MKKTYAMLIAVIFVVSLVPAGLAYTDWDVESTMNKAAAASSAFPSIKTNLENQYGKSSVREWYKYINPNRKANCVNIDEDFKLLSMKPEVKDIDKNRIKDMIGYFYNSADAASKNKYNIIVTPAEIYTIGMGEGLMEALEVIKIDGQWSLNSFGITYYCDKRIPKVLDGYQLVGLDYFPDEISSIKDGNYIRQDFNEGNEYRKMLPFLGDTKKLVKPASFSSYKYMIEALGARVAWTRGLFLNDLREKGVDINSLKEDQMFFWTYYYFNAGQEAGKDELVKHINNKKLDDSSFIMAGPSKKIENGCSRRNNAIMRLATYKAIKELGIFS
jgi:hypothetical protein